MKYKIYSIYDSKSEAYTLPFFYQLDNQAKRTFGDWVNDKEHVFGKHPEDYTLYLMGEFDASSGVTTQQKISSIGTGLQFLTEKNQ